MTFQRRRSISCRGPLFWLILTAGLIPNASGQSGAGANRQPILMDRQKEIALALSACPASVADKAAVYVLERTGYIKVRESHNGFTAIVQHALPNSQDPQCMDAEGARTFLPRYLKMAEWRAQGKSAAEIRALVAEALATGSLQSPTKPGIDYMLSTQNLTPNAKGEIVPFPPHVMFYAPYKTNADLGLSGALGPDGNPDGPVFVAGEGTPYALIIVPVGDRGASHTHPKQPE